MANPYEDVELSPEGMRALAHPVRLRILLALRSEPGTATKLSRTVGASPSVTSWHLRHLAEHGLIVDAPELGRGRERWWRTVGRGFRFAATDESSRAAANALQSMLDQVAGDVVGEWRREVEPALEPEWRREAGSHDTSVALTADELAQVNRDLEAVLAPYVRRKQRPDDARRVRIIRHTMPGRE
jgi:DNA-binding transcriptional ArsR family regulator